MIAPSVTTAAIVSGLRLKPYLDAGETYTPPTFALYPALIALLIAVPVVFILRKWQGKTEKERQSFLRFQAQPLSKALMRSPVLPNR